MKKYICIFLLLSAAGFTQAQDIIEVNKNIVSIDGKECMKVDRKDPNNIGISDLSGNDLVYLKFANDKFGRRYNTIVFVNAKKSLYTQQYIYANAKMLIKRLLDNHMLDGCTINDAKVDNFIAKFGENVQLN
jgi:hypothetical protein